MTGRIGGFDAHMHVNDPAFSPDRDERIESLAARGYSGMVTGWDLASSETAVGLAARHGNLFAAAGIHPCCLPPDLSGAMRRLSLLAASGARAIGECGLDETAAAADGRQQEALSAQLDLALALRLPAVLHVRGRHGAMLALLRRRKENPPLLLHGASLSRELLSEYLKLGCMISIGGLAARSGAKRAKETAALVPGDRLCLETDCPFQPPAAGEACLPESLLSVAGAVAAIRGADRDTILALTQKNARRFYRLPWEETA